MSEKHPYAPLKKIDGRYQHPRMGEHYGPYGQNCINTGQFDAGECWKCTIKRLRAERDRLRIERDQCAAAAGLEI